MNTINELYKELIKVQTLTREIIFKNLDDETTIEMDSLFQKVLETIKFVDEKFPEE